jgi:D-aspartate ligase
LARPSPARGGTPPTILLGGTTNAVSIARSLGGHGIPVHALNESSSRIRYSRFSRFVPLKDTGDVQKTWLDWLSGEGREHLRGAVLLPCSDDGLELIARNRAHLGGDFILPESNDELTLALLDKARTLALAKKSGIPAPRIWRCRDGKALEDVLAEIPLPCALKPCHSHLFQRHFPGRKLFVVSGSDELRKLFEETRELGLEMLITEIIPGRDDQHCSYYTYIDENGEPLLHFTKRKLRQHPNYFGLGTYQLTDWNPEVAGLGLAFFREIGLRGIGNVEFKRDSRDGDLKLIECNPRFTAANEMLALSGIDFSLLVYNRLTGRPLPPAGAYKSGVRLLRPLEDYLAFRGYQSRGEMSLGQWLLSLSHRQHLAYFHWSDPWPSLVHGVYQLRLQFRKRVLGPWRAWRSRRDDRRHALGQVPP